MRTKIISFVITAAIVFSAGLFGAGKVSTITSTLIEYGFTPVGLKRAQNHVYARCKLNGRDVSLIVDTGAQSTLVSALKLASLTGPVKKVEGHAYGMLGQMSSSVRAGEISDFQVGAYKAGVHPVGLWDFSRHTPAEVGMSVDGLLGIDFLRRHQAVIDCFQMNLFLKAPSAPSSSAALSAGLRAGGCTEIPIHLAPDGLAVSTRINGTAGYLVVDTGSPWTILREHAIADLKLRRASTGIAFRAGNIVRQGIGDVSGRGGTALQMVYFTTMEIGGFNVPTQGVGVADLPTLKGGGPGGVFFGYLGQDLLAYYVGVIDCHALKLFLRVDPVIEVERKKRNG